MLKLLVKSIWKCKTDYMKLEKSNVAKQTNYNAPNGKDRRRRFGLSYFNQLASVGFGPRGFFVMLRSSNLLLRQNSRRLTVTFSR